MCHPRLVAHTEVTLIPKLRVNFAEFLQHSSLKRLGIFYLSTCVGFGYGLNDEAISWNNFTAFPILIRKYNLRHPSHLIRYRNINLFPIDYDFRPRLRSRLNLRGLALRRNPWIFGESVSHTFCRYSCQHSHFRYLQELSRVSLQQRTERSATTQ